MEESVNFVKGYGKINPSDDHDHKTTAVPPPSTCRKTTAIITITTLLLIAIATAAIIATTTIHHSHSKPSNSDSDSIKSINSIKSVCSVTPNPDSCFTDISSINSINAVDPEVIFNLTLQLSVTELVNISSLPKTLISRSNDLRTGSALRDCASLFDDALSQLGRSVESMRVGDDKAVLLTEAKVADLKTWISAAMTDLQTCVDGLEEMESKDLEEVKMVVKRSNEFMSNSLAILGNMDEILKKLGLHLH